MAELTQAQLESKIADIDAAIAAIIAAPSGIPDYRQGQISVNTSQTIRELRETRKMYQNLLDTFPAEDFNRIASDIDEFGEDQSEYLGE